MKTKLLNAELLDNGCAVINIGDAGAYVMVEETPKGFQVTVINDDGDVWSENEYLLED